MYLMNNCELNDGRGPHYDSPNQAKSGLSWGPRSKPKKKRGLGPVFSNYFAQKQKTTSQQRTHIYISSSLDGSSGDSRLMRPTPPGIY